MYPAAAKNVSHHLKKLAKDGKITKCQDSDDDGASSYRAN